MRTSLRRCIVATAVAAVALGVAAPAGAVEGSDVLGVGAAEGYGSMVGVELNQPVLGLASSSTGQGYWMVASDGGIFAFGDAPFLGSTGGIKLNQPMVGMAPTRSGQGYWMFARDGGVFAFGDATFLGSMGGTKLNQPVLTGAATETGQGYWMFASDGGVFAFGDAPFHGSLGGKPPSSPIVGMAVAPGDSGYWLATADGTVYPFGAAGDFGNGKGAFDRDVVGIARTPTGQGYWLADSSGRVVPFGDAVAFADGTSRCLVQPVVGLAARPQADGVWLATAPVPAAATAGRAPLDQLTAESNQITAMLRARQGCQEPTPASAVSLRAPVDGWRLSSPYGNRIHPIYGVNQLHRGADLVGSSTIRAAADGTVVEVRSRIGYGVNLVVDHGGRVATMYGHLSSASVKAGDAVKAGQAIAVMGATGFATGPHLHFELRLDGVPVDPMPRVE